MDWIGLDNHASYILRIPSLKLIFPEEVNGICGRVDMSPNQRPLLEEEKPRSPLCGKGLTQIPTRHRESPLLGISHLRTMLRRSVEPLFSRKWDPNEEFPPVLLKRFLFIWSPQEHVEKNAKPNTTITSTFKTSLT